MQSTSFPPRRSWFQFSLRTLLVVVAITALGAWTIAGWRERQESRWVALGLVDPRSSIALETNLEANNIEFRFDGGKRYLLMVHRRDAERAQTVLIHSKDSGSYEIEFYDKEWDR